jgi:hypothetical protein
MLFSRCIRVRIAVPMLARAYALKRMLVELTVAA